MARDASFLAGLRNFPGGGSAHRPEKVVHALAFREDAVKPTFVIDIGRQMERKLAVLAAYGTQFRRAKGAGEVFPGGRRPFFDQVRSAHAWYGSLIRCEYGEPYWDRGNHRGFDLGPARHGNLLRNRQAAVADPPTVDAGGSAGASAWCP